jgi:hypothetical protein
LKPRTARNFFRAVFIFGFGVPRLRGFSEPPEGGTPNGNWLSIFRVGQPLSVRLWQNLHVVCLCEQLNVALRRTTA